jgi:hypothetical protein
MDTSGPTNEQQQYQTMNKHIQSILNGDAGLFQRQLINSCTKHYLRCTHHCWFVDKVTIQ